MPPGTPVTPYRDQDPLQLSDKKKKKKDVSIRSSQKNILSGGKKKKKDHFTSLQLRNSSIYP